MGEIMPDEAREELREEEHISDIGDSVSVEEIAESVSPEPIIDDYPQCRLSDEDVERIAHAISRNIVDTLKGD